MEDEGLAGVARALAHPARVRILRMLAAHDACIGAEIFSEIPLAQSTISQHLAVLREAGLVHVTPRGTSMVYCITPNPLEELGDALAELLSNRSDCAGEEPGD